MYTLLLTFLYICICLFQLPAGSDFTAYPYTVSFTAGQAYVIFMVLANDDAIIETPEEFSVTIVSTDESSVVTIGSPSTSVVTVEDDDPGTCTIVIFLKCHTLGFVYIRICYI